MFTKQQLASAHAKVKSGADYPAYVAELKTLGVTRYDFVVATGRNVFFGAEGSLETDAKYAPKKVPTDGNPEALAQALKIHQAGKTDSLTFFQQAADAGTDRWTCDLEAMEVVYKDVKGQVLAWEAIPPAR